jgi:hypothetical protein
VVDTEPVVDATGSVVDVPGIELVGGADASVVVAVPVVHAAARMANPLATTASDLMEAL